MEGRQEEKSKDPFPMTRRGYKMAVAYLVCSGEYESFLANGFSVDGYSLVAYANRCREKASSQTPAPE